MQAAGGIHDEHVAAGVHRFTPRFFGQPFDRRSVCLSNFALVNLRLDRLRHNCQLLPRRRTIDVHRYQQRPVSAVLQPVCELAGCGGFAGTLQSSHENDRGRLRSKFHFRGIVSENLDQFVANDLDDLLAGRKRAHDFLAQGFVLDLVDE